MDAIAIDYHKATATTNNKNKIHEIVERLNFAEIWLWSQNDIRFDILKYFFTEVNLTCSLNMHLEI